MPGLMTIELKGLHFFAYHGLYAEERKTGNEFEIDLFVTHQPVKDPIKRISETVNYVGLFEILQKEMERPRELLETFVMQVSDIIHEKFPRILKVEISMTKLHPPIPGFTGRVGVQYVKEYE
jgi:dihydroneopterin aldolase